MSVAAGSEWVVTIHGLYFNGYEMSCLRRAFREAGYRTRRFRYPTLRQPLHLSAGRLQRFLHKEIPSGDRVHLVAHSMGGLLVRHLLAQFPNSINGRVVMLGTPNQGSEVARQVASRPFGTSLVGLGLHQGFDGSAPPWPEGTDLGVIAGTRSQGMGRWLHQLHDDNDGSVTVAETHLDGQGDHLVVDESHFGLLYSRQVHEQIVTFLQSGRFQT